MNQINDEVAIDAALSVMTTSESEMSSNDHVISMEVLETNNAVTQIVVDHIYLNIVSINRHTPFHSIGWNKVTPPVPHIGINTYRNKHHNVSPHR